MSVLLLYVIAFHFYVKEGSTSFLNQDQLKISMELIKRLEVRQCILVGDVKTQDLVSTIKKFSLINIPTSYLNYQPLINLVYDTEAVHYSTGLIFAEKNLSILEELSNVFQTAKATYKLRNFTWLIFLAINDELSTLVTPYDCEFIVIQAKNATTYKLTEIYTVKNKFFSLGFGIWAKDIGFKIIRDNSFYRPRLNLQEIELRVLSEPGFTAYMHETIGIEMSLITELFDGFAYRLNLTIVHDFKNSALDMMETLNMNGDLTNFPYPFGMDSTVWDAVGSIYEERTKWFIKHPSVQLKADYYLQPFNRYSWLALLSIAILATFFILIAQNAISEKNRSLIDNLFLGLESLIGQCGNDDIKNISLRLPCLSIRFIALISMGLYGAIITSYFAVEVFQPPFTSLKEFVANGEYCLLKLEEKDSFIEDLISKNADLENLTTFIQYDSFLELSENVCHGKYAAYVSKHTTSNYNLSCRIYEIPEYFKVSQYNLMIQRNNQFTKILNENLIRFYEIGFQMRYQKQLNRRKTGGFIRDSFQWIVMDQMVQVMSIPLVGILLGSAIIITEIIISKIRNEFKRQKTDGNFRQRKKILSLGLPGRAQLQRRPATTPDFGTMLPIETLEMQTTPSLHLRRRPRTSD